MFPLLRIAFIVSNFLFGNALIYQTMFNITRGDAASLNIQADNEGELRANMDKVIAFLMRTYDYEDYVWARVRLSFAPDNNTYIYHFIRLYASQSQKNTLVAFLEIKLRELNDKIATIKRNIS